MKFFYAWSEIPFALGIFCGFRLHWGPVPGSEIRPYRHRRENAFSHLYWNKIMYLFLYFMQDKYSPSRENSSSFASFCDEMGSEPPSEKAAGR
jgi:hypothetical protein